MLISSIKNKVKLVIFHRDYFSNEHQGFSYTKNVVRLTLNNFLTRNTFEMEVSQNKLFLQIGSKALDFNISLEEIIDEKLSTLQNGNSCP